MLADKHWAVRLLQEHIHMAIGITMGQDNYSNDYSAKSVKDHHVRIGLNVLYGYGHHYTILE